MMYGKNQITRRSFLRASAVAAGGAFLAACTAAAPPAAAPAGGEAAAPAEEQVTLRLQNWFSEGDLGAWQIGLDRVAESNPEIAIKLEFNPYSETAVKIMAEAAAGNLPDLIMASNEHTPLLSCSELLMDLNPFIEKEPDVNPDDFAPGVSQGFKMWDRWWGFPYDQSTWAVYYNQAMFDEAGIDYPAGVGGEIWTMDQFVEVAKALTKPDGEQWGVWYPAGPNPNQYLDSCFIYSVGGRNFDDDLRKCIIDSPESAAGLQAVVDLMHKHKVAPTPAELAGGDIDYFASGLAAMHLNGQWDLMGKNATSDFDFDVAYLPIIDAKRGVTGGSGFCISSKTEHPDEAWTWLRQFTSTEVLGEMVGSTGRGIPARWSAAETYLEGAGKAENAGIFIDQLSWAFNDRSVVAFYEFVDSYNRNLAPIYASGEGNIEEALAKVAEETNAAMDEKWSSCTLNI